MILLSLALGIGITTAQELPQPPASAADTKREVAMLYAITACDKFYGAVVVLNTGESIAVEYSEKLKALVALMQSSPDTAKRIYQLNIQPPEGCIPALKT